MQFKQTLIPGVINRDLASSKRDGSTHFDVVNFDVYMTERSLSFSSSRGTKLFVSTSGTVIGSATIVERNFIFVTIAQIHLDLIYEIVGTSLVLIKSGNWNFDTNYPIKAVGIHETDTVNKLYFVDGLNQARVINVSSDDIPDSLDFLPKEPAVGAITAESVDIPGRVDAIVEYGYTLYTLGGSESGMSVFTVGVNISEQNSSAKVIVTIPETSYRYLRVYRLMYKTYKGTPDIAMIVDRAINPEGDIITLYDGGEMFISAVGIERFTELGSDYLVPNAIKSKKQTLLLANFKTEPFRVETLTGPDKYDPRAFGFETSGTETPAGAIGPGDELQNFLLSDRSILKPNNILVGYVAYSNPTPPVFELDIPLGGDITLEPVVAAGISINLRYSIYDKATRELYKEGIIKIPNAESTVTLPEGQAFYITMDVTLSPTGSNPPPLPSFINVDVDRAGNYDVYAKVVFADIINIRGFKTVVTDIETTPIPSFAIDGILTPITSTNRTLIGATGIEYRLASSVGLEDIDKYTDKLVRANMLPIGDKWQLDGGIKLKGVNSPAEFYSINGVPMEFDAVNPDVHAFKYQSNAITLGAEGVNLRVEVKFSSNKPEGRTFKKGEIYRIGVVFRDAYKREAPTLWVCDQYISYRNPANTNKPYVSVLATVSAMPKDAVSFRFVIVERKEHDKSILMQGVVQPTMDLKAKATSELLGTTPYPHIKRLVETGASADTKCFAIDEDFVDGYDYTTHTTWTTTIGRNKEHNLLLSPEVVLFKKDPNVVSLIPVGSNKIIEASTRYTVTNKEDASKSGSGFRSDLLGRVGAVVSVSGAPKTLLDGWNQTSQDSNLVGEMYLKTGSTIIHTDYPDTYSVPLKESKFLDFDNTLVLDVAITPTINYVKFNGTLLSGYESSNLNTEYTACYALETEANPADIDYSEFSDPFSGEHLGRLPIADLYTGVLHSQYGGQTYFNKSSNLYIPSSASSTIGGTVVLTGDTYVGLFKIPIATDARHNLDTWELGLYSFMEVELESSVAPKEFNERVPIVGSTLGTKKGVEVKQYYEYNEIFSHIPSAILSASKPATFIEVTDYPNRIVVTSRKTPGEPTDSWTNILLGTYLDLESSHGAIMELVEFNDNILAFQHKAIAIIDIYPRAQTTTSAGAVNLGKGKVLDDYRYLKVESGVSGKFNTVVAGGSLFYLDTWNKAIQEVTLGDVTALQGFNVLLKTRLPSLPFYNLTAEINMFAYLNETKKEVHFKVGLGNAVLVYNYERKAFTARRTYLASFFIPTQNAVLGVAGVSIYKHDAGEIGKYYNNTVAIPSLLKFRLEPLPGVDKVFDSVVIHKEGLSNFTEISVESPVGRLVNETHAVITSGLVPTDFRAKFDMHSMHLPRIKGGRERWRTKEIWLGLSYTTNTNEALDVDYIDVKFSVKK